MMKGRTGVMLFGLYSFFACAPLGCGNDQASTEPKVMVIVEPNSASVEVGAALQLIAEVTGTANTGVTWFVAGGEEWGSVDATGLYTAPATVPNPPTASVRATSVVNSDRSGLAIVTIVATVATPPGFVRVLAGSFTMGDGETACTDAEYPVTLTEDFFLGQTEVTNEQYLEMVQWSYDHGNAVATAISVRDAMGSTQELLDLDGSDCEIAFSGGVFSLRNAGQGINPDHPVKEVTWYGAVAYCDWLNLKEGVGPAYNHTSWECNEGDPYRAQGYRLPTEAEWEYAAQYDDERTYPWGNAVPSCTRANYGGCGSWTKPVSSYPAEKMIGRRGLYDMAGNVWEWCNDWYQCDPNPSRTDPPGPPRGTNMFRVPRGGSWYESAQPCASRSMMAGVSVSNGRLGFRVARTVTP
jgi:formylglycine-generating enzyme required for sulfatase activity